MVFLLMMPQSLPRAPRPAAYLRFRPCQTNKQVRRHRRNNLHPHANQPMSREVPHHQSRHQPCLRVTMTTTIPIDTTRLLMVYQPRNSMMSTPCLPVTSARRPICMEPASLGHHRRRQQIGPPHHHRRQSGQLRHLHRLSNAPRQRLPCRLPLSHLAHLQRAPLIFDDP